MDDTEANNWVMGCHLSGLAGFLPPLIIWLIKKDDHPFVNDQGKEALNFQITVALALAIIVVLTVPVMAFTFGFGACLMVPLALAAVVLDVVYCIIAAMAANKGQAYRYPVALRLVE